MKVAYNNRRFVSVASAGGGDVDTETVFHYRQEGEVVWATYDGGGGRRVRRLNPPSGPGVKLAVLCALRPGLHKKPPN